MKKVFILGASLSIGVMAAAQSVTIQGAVKKQDGPVPFATLSVKGTAKTTTDQSGHYQLVLDNAGPIQLEATAAGYLPQTIKIPVLTQDTLIDFELSIGENSLEEVIISATRRPQDIRNVVASVSVINHATLQKEIALTPDPSTILANQVPGFGPTAQTGNNVGQNLRGRPMLVMIDGVSQSSPLRNAEVDLRSIDPGVLQQIEVIKGATAIYGNGAAGGLVNYTTLVPDTADRFAGKTQLNLNGSVVNLKNSAGGRISQQFYGKLNKFDYVVSGMYEQTGEYKDADGDVVGPNYSLGETDSYNAFAKLGYTPAANQRIQVTYNLYSSLQNSNFTLVNGDIANGKKATGVLGKPAGIPTGVKYNHNLHLMYTIDSLFKNTSLTADAYYEIRKDIFYVSLGRFDGGDGQSLATNDKKGARLFLHTPVVQSTAAIANLSYGFDFLNDKTAQPLVDGRTWVPTMDMNNLAPFVQADATLFRHLIAKAGFRYEKVAIHVDDYQTLRITGANGTTVTPSFAVTGGALKYDARLFNAGLKYNKWAFFSPYVSFSQGFSVMDIGLALRDAKVDNISKINTDAVLVNNYEAGFDTRIRNLQLTVSGYTSTSKLGIEVVYDPATDLFNTARSPEKIYGFEAAAQYTVSPQLQLGASYSYTEGKRDINDNGQYNDDTDMYLNGRRIAPPKITGMISYTPITDLNFTLYYTGIGSRSRFDKNDKGVYNGNEGAVKAYNLFNLLGSYAVSKNTRITLGVDNLFNEDYFPARAQWFMQPGFYSKGRGRSVNVGVTIGY
ncbi:TonB-dependent receptor [Niabella beijingensis]|uniref:TonB-dependent receptor n=1 Tax=Niabella beijingensis TaxID=2872700 RepID=UPI001CC08976|nr:TonB-dependent receptor [Niabella beijingensis]MBZ4188108.1 TonB-dependent receptor [Niabella beijingensis]